MSAIPLPKNPLHVGPIGRDAVQERQVPRQQLICHYAQCPHI